MRRAEFLTVLRATMLMALLLVAGTGCTDPGLDGTVGTPTTGDPAARASAALEFPCGPADHDVDVPESYATIADAVALPTADSADRALQTSHRADEPSPNYFGKTGLLVQAGVAFTIEVAEPPETARIGWGSPAEFGSKIRADGCPGEGWMAFAGGFLVNEPHCVEVVVTARGEQERVQVGSAHLAKGRNHRQSRPTLDRNAL